MAVDVEVGEGGSIGGMEQLGARGDPDQDVGLGRAASAIAIFLPDGLVEGGDAASGLFLTVPEAPRKRRDPLS